MNRQSSFLFLLFSILFSTLTAQNTLQLFEKIDELKNHNQSELYLPYLDIARVEVNPLLRSTKSPSYHIGDKITIPLFHGGSLASTIDRVNVNVNGTLTIRARLEDYPKGYLLMSVTHDLINATLSIPEKNEKYSIKSHHATGVTYLKRLDIGKLDIIESGEDIIPMDEDELSPEQIQRLEEAAARKDNSTAIIGVLVVYTPAAREWATSNGSNIENIVAQSMERAQLALDNSQLPIEMTLVYSGEVNYTESGSSNTDLNRLTNKNDGHLDEVHTLRNIYGGDLVGFFTRVDDTGGLGWLLNNKAGMPNYGFSITRIQQAAWTYTHIHEMGHNMGAHHHKAQNTQPGPTIWSNWPENTWSAGWRWIGTDGKMYCSLMTYNSGSNYDDGIDATTIGYFSNPSVSYNGAPTGHATDGDNARTLRELRHLIAAYTDPMDDPGFSIPLCQVVDNCNLIFETGGHMPWIGQLNTFYYGGAAAQSGAIADDEQSWMQTTVNGPGEFGFFWKVSSEVDYDFLRFSINGEIKDSISGEVDWHEKTYTLESGAQTLRWTYIKDEDVKEGQDKGWVDKVTFTPTTSPDIVTFVVGDENKQPLANAMITVTAVGNKTLSAPSEQAETEKNNKLFASNLTSPETLLHYEASVNALKEESITWMSWENGQYHTNIGNNASADFSVASRWIQSDLATFEGMYIDKIALIPNEPTATYTLKIWTAMPDKGPVDVYSQPIGQITTGTWNEIELDTKWLVDGTQELWFGYNVVTQKGYPAGADSGPSISHKGNKIRWNGSWVELSDLNAQFTYNWCLKAQLLTPEPITLFTDARGRASFEPQFGQYEYTVELDGYSSESGSFFYDRFSMMVPVSLTRIIPEHEVTFHLDMNDVNDFDPVLHEVFVSGTFNQWAEPGTEQAQKLQLLDGNTPLDLIYTLTIPVKEGIHQYKYFSDAFGEGFAGAEWMEEYNRIVMIEGDTLINDTWGEYELIQYTVSIAIEPEAAGSAKGEGDYQPGETVTVWAIPSDEFTFSRWMEQDSIIGTQSGFSFVMPNMDVNLVAVFEEKIVFYDLVLQANPAVGGTVSGAGSYAEGIISQLSAIPAEGYRFVSWEQQGTGVISTDAILIYTMPANHVTLTANFDLVSGIYPTYATTVKYYPNPANDQLTLKAESTLSRAEITDLMGRTVFNKFLQSNETTIPTGHLHPGIYLLRIYTDEGVATGKLQIKR
jgi:hypothetical protein